MYIFINLSTIKNHKNGKKIWQLAVFCVSLSMKTRKLDMSLQSKQTYSSECKAGWAETEKTEASRRSASLPPSHVVSFSVHHNMLYVFHIYLTSIYIYVSIYFSFSVYRHWILLHFTSMFPLLVFMITCQHNVLFNST